MAQLQIVCDSPGNQPSTFRQNFPIPNQTCRSLWVGVAQGGGACSDPLAKSITIPWEPICQTNPTQVIGQNVRLAHVKKNSYEDRDLVTAFERFELMVRGQIQWAGSPLQDPIFVRTGMPPPHEPLNPKPKL